MKSIACLSILAALLLGGEALQCYNCKQSKMNGVEVEEGSTACEGTEETCKDGNNACMTAKFSFTMDMGQKAEMETVQTQCFVNVGEETACQQMKSAMAESGAPVEDFTCSVKFCDTDLCTDDDSAAKKDTICIPFLVSAFLFCLYGVFF